MFDMFKINVVDYYLGEDFARLLGHENPKDPISDNSSNGCVLTIYNHPILSVSKLQIYNPVSVLYSEYEVLSNAVIDLLPLKIIIKDVVKNW